METSAIASAVPEERVISGFVSNEVLRRLLCIRRIDGTGNLQPKIWGQVEIACDVIAAQLKKIRNSRWQREIFDNRTAKPVAIVRLQTSSELPVRQATAESVDREQRINVHA